MSTSSTSTSTSLANSTSPTLPFVGRMAGTALAPDQERLLQRCFVGRAEIFVEQAFHSGYSGASAYLVTSPGQAALVAKIAHPHDIVREFDAYQQWVAQTAPQHTTRLQGDLLVSDDGQLGLITYSFAGGDPGADTHNLSLYYQTHGAVATAAVIDRIFRSYGRQWWTNHQLRRIVLGEEYDRLLPVHLQVSLAIGDQHEQETSTIHLTSDALDPSRLDDLALGQMVVLHNFEVIKVRAQSITVLGRPTAGVRSAPIRVRVEGHFADHYQRGDRIDVLPTLVTATRAMLLCEAMTGVLPPASLVSETFVYHGERYANPLSILDDLLATRQDAEISIIHGDLNLQNILIDATTGFAWLIDFAETRRGPALFDLQRLEAQIVTKLMPPLLAEQQVPPAAIARLFSALHSAMPRARSPLPTLQAPYTVLVTLRQLAQQYLVDNRRWAEYYRGLILVLVGTLKYDELDDQARTVALLSAATLTQLLDQPLAHHEPHDEEQPAPGESPFKGLHYFDVADAPLFFGREKLTTKLVEHLEHENFLAIVGASGSGKSSLVRAGLLPRLTQQTAEQVPSHDAHSKQVHIMTPTAKPLENLAITLTRDAPSVQTTMALHNDLKADWRTLYLYIRKHYPDRDLVLIVDQFEELFTLCTDRKERQTFIDNLLTAVEQHRALTVILTLRADFYAHCAAYETLRTMLEQQQKFIGALSLEELRRAIEEPAQRNGWQLEAGLVDLLLKDVGNEPGGLPLLSHALLETWKRRRGYMLTLAGYAEAGRVHGAIAHTADTLYHEQLSADDQRIARNIFLHLTELGEGSHDTRRRVPLPDLIPSTANQAQVERVINALVEARLLTVDAAAVEVAHEALIREWPTLREWLAENREGLRLQRQLSMAAQEWVRSDQDVDLLYRGARLEQAIQWCEEHPDQRTQLEEEFLVAGYNHAAMLALAKETEQQQALQQAQALAEEQQRLAATQQQRAEEQTRFVRRLAWLSMALAVVFLLAVGAALYARNQQVQAVQSADQVTLALEAQEQQAQLANAAGVRADQKAQEAEEALAVAQVQATIAQEALQQAETAALRARAGEWAANAQLELTKPEPDAAVALLLAQRAVTITRTVDGAILPTALHALDSAVRFALPWQATRRGHNGGVRALAYSPDGQRLVSASWDQSAIVWDAQTGAMLFPLLDHTAGVLAVDYGIDRAGEAVIVTGSADGTAIMWSQEGYNRVTLRGHTGAVNAVAVSPDGQWIATGSQDSTIRLWRSDGSEAALLRNHSGAVNSVAFSPTEGGTHLLTASDDRTVRIWDVNSAEQLRQFDHATPVLAAAWHPNGSQIATAAEDGKIRLWSMQAGASADVIGYHLGRAWTVAYSADGNYLLSSGSDGIIRIWDLANESMSLQLTGHSDAVWTARFSPNGRQIVSGGADRTIRLWDFPPAQGIFTLVNPTDWFFAATYSPDGQLIATASWDQTARLWDAATGMERRVFRGQNSGLTAVAFTPAGTQLVTAGDDGSARIWEVASGTLLQTLEGHTDRIWSVQVSPDGRYIVTSGRDGTARLWDAANGTLLHILAGHTGTVWSVQFTPAGDEVVSAGEDGTVRFWRVADGTEVDMLPVQSVGVRVVHFSHNGKLIATGDQAGQITLWNRENKMEVRRLLGHTDAVRALAFNPTDTSLASGGADGIIRVWDPATGKERFRYIGHSGAVTAVQYSSDGTRLLSAGEDRTVRTWAGEVAILLTLAQSHIQRDPAVFTPEEKLRFGVEDGETVGR